MQGRQSAFFAILAAALLVSGSAFATDYRFVVSSGQWSPPGSWNVGVGYPSTASDTATVTNGGTLNISSDPVSTFRTGSLLIDNGSVLYEFGRGSNYTIVTDSSSGQSGDFLYRSTTQSTQYGGGCVWTWDVSGNFIYAPTAIGGGPPSSGDIIMRGNNKAFLWNNMSSSTTRPFNIDIYGQGIYDNGSKAFSLGQNNEPTTTVTVHTGGSIGSNGATAGFWKARWFVFQGGQSNLPALNAPVDFIYSALTRTDNNVSGRLVVASGVTYPRNVVLGHGYDGGGGGARPYYNWTLKGGNLTVGADLRLEEWGGYTGGEYWLSTLENGTTTSRSLTVNHDLKIANHADYGYSDYYGVKFNASAVRVGHDIVVGDSTYTTNPADGAIDFGSSTVNLGGSATFLYFPDTWTLANWKPGTSTVICDGNGTAYHYTQTLKLYGDCGIALNNLAVNNPGGTVQLFNGVGGGLRLTGNLEIDCGTFTGNKQNILFNGPSHTLTNYVNPSTYLFDDNINLLTGTTVLCLGSDITIKTGDNLNMASGSIIYLFGHTLVADGKTYNGLLYGTSWTNDGGTIYALSNVPEPATLLLLGTGAMGVIGWARRRRLS